MNLSRRKPFDFVTRMIGLFIIALVTLASACSLYAQTEGGQTRDQKTQENPLVGKWESDEATVEIRPDGTLTINGEKYRYKIKGGTIIVSDGEGSMDFPFQLTGNRLTVTAEGGRRVVYTRVSDATDEDDTGQRNSQPRNGGGDIPPELVGKWCYMSNLTGNNSRMSNRCFTLYEDGTYEYYAETSSSGSVASSASQESDSGRWSASGETITAYSKTNGKMTFSLERRNHPKTGDPMLVLDGDAYVTAYRKQPW